MYKIKVNLDKDGNICSISVEKDGVIVELDPKIWNYKENLFGLIDICDEFDNTIKQGEMLNA